MMKLINFLIKLTILIVLLTTCLRRKQNEPPLLRLRHLP